MANETIDVIGNIIQAVSILNKTDEYLESLTDRLSECDSLISDYEHFIEKTPLEEIDLQKLYSDMKSNFEKRRVIKNDMTISNNYKNMVSRFNNITNREFLIQSLKNIQSKLGTKYHNRILKQEDIEKLKEFFKNNITAFSGNSGVGKSTLINNIFSDDIALEGKISAKNKKGKKIKYIINRRPSSIKKLSPSGQYRAKKVEKAKSSVLCKVEHVFAVVKRLFKYRRTRYRGLEKQTAKLNIMFALANFYLADSEFVKSLSA